VSRRADPERIYQARRDAIRNRLISGGKDPDVAERWCDAWEAEAVLQGVARDRDYWDAGELWIDRQCAARSSRPTSRGFSGLRLRPASLAGLTGAALHPRTPARPRVMRLRAKRKPASLFVSS
jgi:hypothetical protein